jgi:uncharacterized integral membrane protein (TIGR00698 family)
VAAPPGAGAGAGVTGWVRQAAPGLLAAVAVAAAARLAGRFLPHTISEVLVAVLLGLVVANWVPLPRSTAPGLRLAVQRVLRIGIVLIGVRLDLIDVARIGVAALGLVAVCMAVAFAFATLGGRALRLPPRLALLIGVGTAVCGNSAIIATAPVVRAEEREVSFAVATITLFGTLAVFLYPLVGRLLALPDAVYGVWSGVAVNDTSQVVAASAAYSPLARDVATVVKLVRNTLMAPLILLIAWWWSRSEAAAGGEAARKGALKAFPVFVLGFLAMALLRTVGVIGPAAVGPIDEAAKACILVALAGVGLSTRLGQMRAVGAAPFYLGFGTAALLAVLSLGLVVALGLGPAFVPGR